MSARTTLAAVVSLIVLSAGSASACARAMPAGADAAIPSNGRLDAGLIDDAVRAEVNYLRCKAGLPQLDAAPSLAKVAATHAKWMAKAMKVSHKSSVGGQSTLKARLSTSGVRFRTGAENIGMVHRFMIDGHSFKIRGDCQFATASGQAIPAHSYATLARTMVNYWYQSPKHKKNMMDRRVTMIGSGAALNPNAPYCGQYFMSQNFAG